MHHAEMRRCLEECDVAGIRRLWHHIAPNMPQPESDLRAAIAIHMARTQCDVVTFRARAYSHRWLTDNGYPSQLPDRLKPKAERMYPQIAEGVGLSVISGKNELMRAIKPYVVGAMNYSIEECYADKKTDPPFVKMRMMEAKDRVFKKLLGIFTTAP